MVMGVVTHGGYGRHEFRQYFPSDPVKILVGFFKNSIMTFHIR